MAEYIDSERDVIVVHDIHTKGRSIFQSKLNFKHAINNKIISAHLSTWTSIASLDATTKDVVALKVTNCISVEFRENSQRNNERVAYAKKASSSSGCRHIKYRIIEISEFLD